MKAVTLFILCLAFSLYAKAQYFVASPDRTVRVGLRVDQKRTFNTKVLRPYKMKINIKAEGKTIVDNQEIGLEIYSDGRRYAFGKSDMKHYVVYPHALTGADDEPLKRLGDMCNRLVLEAANGVTLEISVFDHGVAYRYSISGYEGEYKILDVCDVLPNDKPNAILGTFTGDLTLPWRMMSLDDMKEKGKKKDLQQDEETDEWARLYPSTKIVSWKDALSSVSLGGTFIWYSGKAWRGLAQTQGIAADFTYKYLYGGLSYTPCQELLYLHWDEDFAPFTNIMGSVHLWDVSSRLGFNLPVQAGLDIWNFAPYATASYMALRQHGEVHPGYSKLSNTDHWLAGAGLKVQYMMHGRFALGLAYEFQWFTDKQEPRGRNSLIVSLGYNL